MTLPIILLLQRDGGRSGELVRSAVNERSISPEAWTELQGLLHEHRAVEHAYDRAVEYATNAKQYLDLFPSSPERDALAALPDYVLARDR